MSILNLIRPELLNAENYIPGGEHIENRLHANELPWAPVSFDGIELNFYPSNYMLMQLQEQLAARYGIDNEQITLTRGSDDGIDLVIRLFLQAGRDALMQFPPTFPMYAFYARLQQAELIQCPLNVNDNFSLSLDSIEQNWNPACKVIMFCTPNNPTGTLIDLELISATCARYRNKSLVVVDEAYFEFTQAKSAITLIPQYDNLVVLRTMSKAYGLAGLRLGSIIAQKQLIKAFNKIIAPFILSSPNIEMARRALMNKEWFAASAERIQMARMALMEQLKTMPIIEKVYPSEANFLLIKTPYANEISIWLAKKHIAVRDFPPSSLLHQHLRITVGHEEQNQLLINALLSFNEHVSGMYYAKDIIY